MNRVALSLPGLALCLGLAGCIPWSREVVVQPDLELHVVDAAQQPVAAARVLFVAASDPHDVLHHTLELRTDEQGVARIDERRETETIYPLMMHGVPFYFWIWCVEHEGFLPAVHQFHDAGIEPRQVVVLQPDASGKHCRQNGGRVTVE